MQAVQQDNPYLSRRKLLAGAAAVIPLAAVPALPVLAGRGTDPVFGAIENYRRAIAFSAEMQAKASAIEERIFARIREMEIRIDREQTALQGLHDGLKAMNPDITLEDCRGIVLAQARKMIKEEEGSDEADRLQEEGVTAEDEAMWRLADTIPTTAAGAIALIDFVEDCELEGRCHLQLMREFEVDDSGTTDTEHFPLVVMTALREFLTAQATA